MDTAFNHVDTALLPLGQRVAGEVSRLLSGSVGLDAGHVSLERLGRNHPVYRVRVAANGETRSVVVKQLDPDVAQRNRLVAERWLPGIGLEASAPRLLSAVAGAEGESVWHIYEDVGGVTLEGRHSQRECVAAAVNLIAELHTRAAGHPLLGECRGEGGDLGMHYFTTNVRDALKLLEALRPPAARPSPRQAALVSRLRRRLETLLADTPRRVRLMAEAGGPETMLHGDLWTTNVLLAPAGQGVEVRLVDWDHAGAGPICYDLSTFLYRFQRAERCWLLDVYRNVVARSGWCLPPMQQLNLLCDTAECARYANRIIWPAIALLEDGAAWGFPELSEIEGWFEALEPVFDT